MEGCVRDEQRLTETQMSVVTAETVATPSSAVGCCDQPRRLFHAETVFGIHLLTQRLWLKPFIGMLSVAKGSFVVYEIARVFIYWFSTSRARDPPLWNAWLSLWKVNTSHCTYLFTWWSTSRVATNCCRLYKCIVSFCFLFGHHENSALPVCYPIVEWGERDRKFLQPYRVFAGRQN